MQALQERIQQSKTTSETKTNSVEAKLNISEANRAEPIIYAFQEYPVFTRGYFARWGVVRGESAPLPSDCEARIDFARSIITGNTTPLGVVFYCRRWAIHIFRPARVAMTFLIRPF